MCRRERNGFYTLVPGCGSLAKLWAMPQLKARSSAAESPSQVAPWRFVSGNWPILRNLGTVGGFSQDGLLQEAFAEHTKLRKAVTNPE